MLGHRLVGEPVADVLGQGDGATADEEHPVGCERDLVDASGDRPRGVASFELGVDTQRIQLDPERCIENARSLLGELDTGRVKAAEVFGVHQPRISDLMRGKINKFTIDMLVNMLARIGKPVKLNAA